MGDRQFDFTFEQASPAAAGRRNASPPDAHASSPPPDADGSNKKRNRTQVTRYAPEDEYRGQRDWDAVYTPCLDPGPITPPHSRSPSPKRTRRDDEEDGGMTGGKKKPRPSNCGAEAGPSTSPGSGGKGRRSAGSAAGLSKGYSGKISEIATDLVEKAVTAVVSEVEKEHEKELAAKDEDIKEKQAKIVLMDNRIGADAKTIEEKDSEIASLKRELDTLKKDLAAKVAANGKKDAKIANDAKTIQEKDAQIASCQREIASLKEKDKEFETLKREGRLAFSRLFGQPSL
mmetsp:Transcript_34399/g.80644  ORF Transcript_34399/g.80644 Transcript_34399/m.80644 type:complete len:288 (+) Transcript_34399:90-953(+)